MYRRLQEFDAAVEDFLKALDMMTEHQEDMMRQAQRQLLLAYNDFAVHCYTQGAYQESVLLLNKALKDEQQEKGLYINRGGERALESPEGRRARGGKEEIFRVPVSHGQTSAHAALEKLTAQESGSWEKVRRGSGSLRGLPRPPPGVPATRFRPRPLGGGEG